MGKAIGAKIFVESSTCITYQQGSRVLLEFIIPQYNGKLAFRAVLSSYVCVLTHRSVFCGWLERALFLLTFTSHPRSSRQKAEKEINWKITKNFSPTTLLKGVLVLWSLHYFSSSSTFLDKYTGFFGRWLKHLKRLISRNWKNPKEPILQQI